MGELLDTQDSHYGGVEGPDHEVRRERVAPVSARKEKVWPPAVPITVGSSEPKRFVRGLESPVLLIQVTDGGVFLGHQ
jgi:hypothetical protein